jgi:hypothetical protein
VLLGEESNHGVDEAEEEGGGMLLAASTSRTSAKPPMQARMAAAQWGSPVVQPSAPARARAASLKTKSPQK